MKTKTFSLLALGALLGSAALLGCGGGSSGGSTNPTAVPTGVDVTVSLRDTTGAPVDGIVDIVGVNRARRATTMGAAILSNVPAGAQTARAEVNGALYLQNFVATSGVNAVRIDINPAVGGTISGGSTMGGTPPAPPAF